MLIIFHLVILVFKLISVRCQGKILKIYILVYYFAIQYLLYCILAFSQFYLHLNLV